MAEASILIPPRVTGASLEREGDVLITFDISAAEQHETSAEVTRHPVAEGAEIVDHVQVFPSRITVEGVISATPLLVDEDEADPTPTRHIDAYQTLLEVMRARQPFTLVTRLASYDNVVLTRVPIRRTALTGESIQGAFEFEQVQRVALDVTDIPAEFIASAVRAPASSGRDSGRQSAPAASAGQGRRAGSVLAALAGGGAVP